MDYSLERHTYQNTGLPERTQLQNKPTNGCFICGDSSHFKKECPMWINRRFQAQRNAEQQQRSYYDNNNSNSYDDTRNFTRPLNYRMYQQPTQFSQQTQFFNTQRNQSDLFNGQQSQQQQYMKPRCRNCKEFGHYENECNNEKKVWLAVTEREMKEEKARKEKLEEEKKMRELKEKQEMAVRQKIEEKKEMMLMMRSLMEDKKGKGRKYEREKIDEKKKRKKEKKVYSDSYSLSNSNSGESTSASEEETPKKKTKKDKGKNKNDIEDSRKEKKDEKGWKRKEI